MWRQWEKGYNFFMSFKYELLKSLDQNYFHYELKSRAIHKLMAIPQEKHS